MQQHVFSIHRPWFIRLMDTIVDGWRDWQRDAALHDLEPRTLRDIGIDASEISSIAAEASSRAHLTSPRVTAHGHHG